MLGFASISHSSILTLYIWMVMHRSFVTTAPRLRGRWAKVQGNYFFIVPAVQGK